MAESNSSTLLKELDSMFGASDSAELDQIFHQLPSSGLFGPPSMTTSLDSTYPPMTYSPHPSALNMSQVTVDPSPSPSLNGGAVPNLNWNQNGIYAEPIGVASAPATPTGLGLGTFHTMSLGSIPQPPSGSPVVFGGTPNNGSPMVPDMYRVMNSGTGSYFNFDNAPTSVDLSQGTPSRDTTPVEGGFNPVAFHSSSAPSTPRTPRTPTAGAVRSPKTPIVKRARQKLGASPARARVVVDATGAAGAAGAVTKDKKDRPIRPKVVPEKGGVQCAGTNRKKNTQCRNASLMEYIGPRPLYCAEHIELDPNSLYQKCSAGYQKEVGDGKPCKEVVLKEFGLCYKHSQLWLSPLKGTEGTISAHARLRRVEEVLATLEAEAHAAKKTNADLYQRKNKLIPKFLSMKKDLYAALDHLPPLPSGHPRGSYTADQARRGTASPGSGRYATTA